MIIPPAAPEPLPGGVLALDPGAAFGWSYFVGGRSPVWGHIRVAAKGDEPGKVGSALTIFLRARIEAFRPGCIYFESVYVPTPRRPQFAKAGTFIADALPGMLRGFEDDRSIPMNPLTLERLYGMTFVIQTIAYEYGVPSYKATTGEFCTYFLGRRPPKGRPAKKAANIEMCRLLGWWPVTQDEADGLALGAYGESEQFPALAAKRAAGPLFIVDSRARAGSI